jgi:hypothetical protein
VKVDSDTLFDLIQVGSLSKYLIDCFVS